MFNVLNHIYYYVEKKDDLATTLLLKYTDVLRYQLYSGKKEYVCIEEEVGFLKKFIDIEKIRWEDKLDVNSSWTIQNLQTEFPPFITYSIDKKTLLNTFLGALTLKAILI